MVRHAGPRADRCECTGLYNGTGSFSHPLETYQNMEGSLEIHTPLAHLSSSLMLKLPLLTHTVAKLPRSNDSYVRKSDIMICLCRKSWQKGG